MLEFDPGPPPALARHLVALPSYAAHRDLFWYDWGPVFYRGRLDRSAKVLAVASDPGPTERIAGRTLVGDAGQRVQGLLAKIGLTRGYVLTNAFAYALVPSRASQAAPMLAEVEHRRWRNTLLNMVAGGELQAVLAFGVHARTVVELWDTKPTVPVFNLPHPSSRDETALLDQWRAAVSNLRGVLTPDSGGDPDGPNYGDEFDERDYARIPPRDLPFGVPAWFGDDAWRRTSVPARRNSVHRPDEDVLHTLVWEAPPDQP